MIIIILNHGLRKFTKGFSDIKYKKKSQPPRFILKKKKIIALKITWKSYKRNIIVIHQR